MHRFFRQQHQKFIYRHRHRYSLIHQHAHTIVIHGIRIISLHHDIIIVSSDTSEARFILLQFRSTVYHSEERICGISSKRIGIKRVLHENRSHIDNYRRAIRGISFNLESFEYSPDISLVQGFGQPLFPTVIQHLFRENHSHLQSGIPFRESHGKYPPGKLTDNPLPVITGFRDR